MAGGATQRPAPLAPPPPGSRPAPVSLPRAPNPSTPGPVLPRTRHRRRWEQALWGAGGSLIAAMTQPGFLGLSVPAPPRRRHPPPPSTPQRSPLPPTQAWPRRRSELLPNYLVGPQSLRSGLGGAAITSSSLPPPPPSGGGGGSSGPFNYQLSRSTAPGVRLRPRRLLPSPPVPTPSGNYFARRGSG